MKSTAIRQKIEDILDPERIYRNSRRISDNFTVFTDGLKNGVRQKYCFVNPTEKQIAKIKKLPHVVKVKFIPRTKNCNPIFWGFAVYFDCSTREITL